jgi:hypothetical protein
LIDHPDIDGFVSPYPYFTTTRDYKQAMWARHCVLLTSALFWTRGAMGAMGATVLSVRGGQTTRGAIGVLSQHTRATPVHQTDFLPILPFGFGLGLG